MPDEQLDEETARAIVQPYYDALLAQTPEEVREIAERATTPDWVNCTDEGVCETREQAITRWSGHRAFIPDLDLEIRELVASGDKVVVRGVMSGSPTAPIMGVDPEGRSFRIMTIDIHTIADGRIVHSFHLEDWGSGMAQMKGAADWLQ